MYVNSALRNLTKRLLQLNGRRPNYPINTLCLTLKYCNFINQYSCLSCIL